jgi:hypothetical protein
VRFGSGEVKYAYVGFKNLPAGADDPKFRLGVDGTWVDMSWWTNTDDPQYYVVGKKLGLTKALLDAGTAKIARLLVGTPGTTGGGVTLADTRTRTFGMITVGSSQTIIDELDVIEVV